MSDEENKKLSGAELREKLKEEYKRELKERKKFLEAAKQANQTAKLANQLSEIEKLANLNDTDDTDEWIRRLNEVSAISEAKLEIAMGNEEFRQALAEHKNTELLLGGSETPETTAPPTSKSLGDDERTDAPAPTEEGVDTPKLPEQKKTLGDLEL